MVLEAKRDIQRLGSLRSGANIERASYFVTLLKAPEIWAERASSDFLILHASLEQAQSRLGKFIPLVSGYNLLDEAAVPNHPDLSFIRLGRQSPRIYPYKSINRNVIELRCCGSPGFQKVMFPAPQDNG